MSFPPLYKYLDVEGAKKTLGKQCFRFAKPSDYKDIQDMTAHDLFPEELETALAKMPDGFVDAIMSNLYAPPTCSPRLRPTVRKLQAMFCAKPELAPIVAAGIKNDPEKSGLGVKTWKTRSEAFVKDTNVFMQNYRVFCVTTEKSCERMWREYTKDHRGIAVRVTPSVEKESKYLKFAPVMYQEKRPAIFPKVADFAAESLFGNPLERARTALEGIIYAKTNAYKFESEYRLAIPLDDGEEDYRTQPFHPEEIAELYLGAAMTDADKQEIAAMAKVLNPLIAVFQTKKDREGGVSFDPAS